MKLNRPDQSIIGDLGAGAAQRWNPSTYDYYERQWRTQRGAWGDSGAETRLEADVAAVVEAFRLRGTAAGLLEAKNRGILEGARLYLSVRADTEEELAVRLARVRARLATRPLLIDKLNEAFLAVRLDEVRKATAQGWTPPQAIADKPEVPRKHIPRWIPITMLILSGIALLSNLSQPEPRSRRELERDE